MPEKRHPGYALLLVLAVAAQLQAASKYRKWVQREVVWIISEEEKRDFKALSSDEEREAFVEAFWQRRDPTPATLRNEYREEYQQRLRHALESFREGVPGWKTDRGRVYLIHGPPDRVETFSRSGGNAYGLAHEGTHRVWHYHQLFSPWESWGAVVFVFRPDQGLPPNSVAAPASAPSRRQPRPLITKSGARVEVPTDSSASFRLVAAGPPSIVANQGLRQFSGAEMTSLIKELLRAPTDFSDHKKDREASRRLMNEQVQAEVLNSEIPLELAVHRFWEEGEALITLAWEWPLAALDFQQENELAEARADLLVWVNDPQGRLVDEFFKSFRPHFPRALLAERRFESYSHFNEFHLPAGSYELVSLLRDGSGQTGLSRSPIEISVPPADKLFTSDLVLARRLVPAVAGVGSSLGIEQWQVFPHPGSHFSSQDRLILFLKIYQAQAGPQGVPSVALSYNFLRGEEVYRSGSQRLLTERDPEGDTLTFSTVVPLQDFHPGAYRVQVTAVDLHSHSYSIARAAFSVN